MRKIYCGSDFTDQLESMDSPRGLIVFPTDTLYALGCRASDAASCARIYSAKKRPADMPLPLLVENTEMLYRFGVEIPERIRQFLDRIWPAPLTVILRVMAGTDIRHLNSKNDALAFRIPDYALVKDLIKKIGEPVTCSSANISGIPPVSDPLNLSSEINREIDWLFSAGSMKNDTPSTILDLTEETPKVVRKGLLPVEKLEPFFDSLN